jgi:ribosomal protein S18 acetylase RimI-like enzyme
VKGEGKDPEAGAVRIAPLAPEDVERVSALAEEIWRQHYPGIIGVAQIEYMLKQRYDPRVMRAELQRTDVWWDKLLAGSEIVGFASYFLTDQPGEMKLDKLYVHPRHQRKGYGALLLERACANARARGCSTLTLAVNKNNRSAIAAYLKHGFRIREAAVKDIGGGFVMDDYIMEKALETADRRR